MENPGRWKHSAIIYCCLVFVISWSLWISAERSGDATLNFSILLLDVHIPRETVLVILGNVAPGLVAIVMGLVNGEKPFRNFLRPPKAPKLSICLRHLCTARDQASRCLWPKRI